MSSRREIVAQLRRRRERSPFLRTSLGLLIVGGVASWFAGDMGPGVLLSGRRQANLDRFLGELRPFPLQGRDWDWRVAWDWATRILQDKGWEAAAITLAISVAAIVMAGLVGGLLALPASRRFASAEPWAPAIPAPSAFVRRSWGLLTVAARGVLLFQRAIPEYVWAFLLLALLGPTAWPAVLALALHNSGILGKLGSEVVDDLDHGAVGSLRGLGAGRLQLALVAIFPLSLSRFLLYLFYRWETCVREATVLGMLGILSLGFWIRDARARNHYDEMFFFVLLGSVLVLVGDLVSGLVRGWLRRA